MLAAMILGGTIGPAQVLLDGAVGPAALAGWRHLVGGLALIVLALRSRAAFRAVRGLRLWSLFVATGLFSAGYQVSFLKAVTLTGGAMGTVVAVATVPLFTGLAARKFDGERLTRNWLIGSGIAVAGSFLLLVPGAGARVDPAGLAWGVLAGAVFAGYTVLSKRISADVPDVHVSTGLTMLIGSVVLAPAIVRDAGNIAQPGTVALIAWLGLITTGAVYALYTKGLQSVSANLAGTLSLGEPLAAALLSTLVLGERLSAGAWTACAIILVGLLTAATGGTPEQKPDQQYSWPRAVGMVAMPVGIPVHPAHVGRRRPAVGRVRISGAVTADEFRSTPTPRLLEDVPS
ncbi:EamA family transporter [Paractinoplanes ferrugineus]|uniref:Transporter n=1 Tax=Paractinoplanes ferrugineus TaxID=113564 RepID=A0A919MMF5_9ACTN|nr:transporter [Actinoplanes ferrugineus]